MRPVLFRLGSFAVPSHETFILLGVLAGAFVFWREARRRSMVDERLLWIVAGTVFLGTICARVGTGWRYVAETGDSTLGGILVRGGRSIVGGLAGAYCGAHLSKRLVGYTRSTGDLFAPAVALAMAIGRIGCLLSEQIGTPTSLPWGVRLDADTLARIPNCPYCTPGVALHPSFVYEIVFHLAMFAALMWYLRPRITVEGDLFKIYLLSYAAFRFVVEFVRGNPVLWFGMTGAQLFLIPSTVVLVAYFTRGAWRAPRLAT
jgi:prolipoprotein diacylglyceryltransferase